MPFKLRHKFKYLFLAMSIMITSNLCGADLNYIEKSNKSEQLQVGQVAKRGEVVGLLKSTFGKDIENHKLLERPEEDLTREDLALMIVDVLRYQDIATKLEKKENPFKDVTTSKGAIILVNELELMKADKNKAFKPSQKVTNKEVLQVIQVLNSKLEKPIQKIHSSYAIKSSSQMPVISHLQEVSFGWSEVQYDANLKKYKVSLSKNPSGFNLPTGYEEPLNFAKDSGAESYLMVYLEDVAIGKDESGKSITLMSQLFKDEVLRRDLIVQMLDDMNQITDSSLGKGFDGITVDFENLRSGELKQGFVTFLTELKKELNKSNKKLNVAVSPNTYYKGYDYKKIGDVADSVILMAHDYEAKSLTKEEMASGFSVTPITPISSIYEALEEMTNAKTGVADKSKIMLQISFGSAQWQIKDNKIINQKPYSPTYDKIFDRLQKSGTQIFYPELYQNPYAIYDENGIKNVIWYEDARSVEAKIDLAKLFDIQGLSLWRLGTIPDYSDSNKIDINLDIVGQLGLIND